MNTLWLLLPAVALLSVLLTGLLRRYALRHLLDLPSARSSHSVPTPRGGGVAIVLAFFSGLPPVWAAGLIDSALLLALLGAGGSMALLGFVDDHRPLPARVRLVGHGLAALWVLYCLGGLPPLPLWGMSLELGAAGWVLGLLYLVWLLNLYNFMDGIDGIASLEALSVCLGGVLLLMLTGGEGSAVLLLLAAAVAGFLYWNLPPARIFMGDAGSCFLGISLGVLSLHAAAQQPVLLWSWLILLGVFIVDASWTLLRRLLRGEVLYKAHCSHAYQRAARRWGSHRRVSIAVTLINLLWLLPLALLVATGWLEGLSGLLLAWLLLLFLAILLGAGRMEDREC